MNAATIGVKSLRHHTHTPYQHAAGCKAAEDGERPRSRSHSLRRACAALDCAYWTHLARALVRKSASVGKSVVPSTVIEQSPRRAQVVFSVVACRALPMSVAAPSAWNRSSRGHVTDAMLHRRRCRTARRPRHREAMQLSASMIGRSARRRLERNKPMIAHIL